MTEPRDLTDLVPGSRLGDVAVADAVGPTGHPSDQRRWELDLDVEEEGGGLGCGGVARLTWMTVGVRLVGVSAAGSWHMVHS